MRNGRVVQQTKLVGELVDHYGRLTEAGIEKLARSVPSGLFLALDRLVTFHLDSSGPAGGSATRTNQALRAPAIRTKPIPKKAAPRIGTVRITKGAKKALAKKATAKKAMAKKATGR